MTQGAVSMLVAYRPLYWAGRTLVALAFAGASLFMADSGSAFALVLGSIGTGLFGVLGLYGLRQLLRRGPRLVLSDAGVLTADTGPDRIGWEEIERVEVFGSHEAPFIAFVVRDPAAVLARMPRGPRQVARLLQAQGLHPLAVNLIGVDRAPHDIQRCALRLWHQARGMSQDR